MKNNFRFLVGIHQKTFVFLLFLLAVMLGFHLYAANIFIAQTYLGEKGALSTQQALPMVRIVLTILVSLYSFLVGLALNRYNRRSLASQLGLSKAHVFLSSCLLLLPAVMLSALVVYWKPDVIYKHPMLDPMSIIYTACLSYIAATRYRQLAGGVLVAAINLVAVIMTQNFHFLYYTYSYGIQIASASFYTMCFIFLFFTKFDLFEAIARPLIFIAIFLVIALTESFVPARTFTDVIRKISYSNSEFSRDIAIEDLIRPSFYDGIALKRNINEHVVGMHLNQLSDWFESISSQQKLTAIFETLDRNMDKFKPVYDMKFPFEKIDPHVMDEVGKRGPRNYLECELVYNERPTEAAFTYILQTDICSKNVLANFHPRYAGNYEVNFIKALEAVRLELSPLNRQILLSRLNQTYHDTAVDGSFALTEADMVSSDFATKFAKWREGVLRKNEEKLHPIILAGRKGFASEILKILNNGSYDERKWWYDFSSVLNIPRYRSTLGVHPFVVEWKSWTNQKENNDKIYYDSDEVWQRLKALVSQHI